MNGKRVHIALAAGLLLTSTVLSPVYAESIDAIEKTIHEKTTEKQQLQIEIEKLQEQMKEADLAMEKNQNELDRIQAEIAETEKTIEQKEADIALLQEKMEQRHEVLKGRLTTLQAQPRTNLITDVLLETNSFADLMDKLYSVNLIFQSDHDILEQQEEDQALLEKERKSVQEKETALRSLESGKKAKQAELDENQKKKQAALQALQQQFQQDVSEIMSMEEELKLMEAQAAAAAALEKEKQDRAAQKPSISADVAESPAPTPSVSSSAGFIRPAAGVYFSGFGTRSDGNHKGLDISSSGTVPIVAAAAGKVSRSYYSSSYGNVVFITHNINGQLYTTVYAHMRTRDVSAGQTVSQGQKIGIMGNTGMSEGQHLHFEIHVGPWNNAKSNAVDPLAYLP